MEMTIGLRYSLSYPIRTTDTSSSSSRCCCCCSSSSSSSSNTNKTSSNSTKFIKYSAHTGNPCRGSYSTVTIPSLRSDVTDIRSRKRLSSIPRSSGSSSSSGGEDDSKASDQAKVPFGYSRKDVLLIGAGVTLIGVGLKVGLEFAGVDPLQAGNVVQLVLVLGLTIGWISTYIFRVSNKEMTYAQQLRDYESRVMEKRLEGLTEAELEALLEQVEEEKQRIVIEEKLR